MASNYWAKLWIEMLDDPKVARLPDSSWRRFSECILLAKELDEGGYLPTVADMAWRLRKDETTIADDMTRLALAGLAELRETADGERWFLPGFENRQSQMSDAERQRRYRERNAVVRLSSQPGNVRITNRNDNRYAKVTEPVTKRNTETETETETEGETDARAREALPVAVPVSSLPPVSVRYEPADRTPGGNGYHPADVPPVPDKPKEKTAEQVAVGEMANAITDVTGVSARLNWEAVGGLARDLVMGGYTAEQVRTHYSRDPVAGAWHWYTAHWKGKKGDPPTLKDVRESIAGATAQRATGAKKKLSQIDLALAMFGPVGPETAAA